MGFDFDIAVEMRGAARWAGVAVAHDRISIENMMRTFLNGDSALTLRARPDVAVVSGL